jgi:hypothetical protein
LPSADLVVNNVKAIEKLIFFRQVINTARLSELLGYILKKKVGLSKSKLLESW